MPILRNVLAKKGIASLKRESNEFVAFGEHTRISSNESIGNKVLLIIYVCELRLNRAQRLSFRVVCVHMHSTLRCVLSRWERTSHILRGTMKWKFKLVCWTVKSRCQDTVVVRQMYYQRVSTIEFSCFPILLNVLDKLEKLRLNGTYVSLLTLKVEQPIRVRRLKCLVWHCAVVDVNS